MQLDNTRIAIRERGLLDTLDLALHVTREFVGPWLLCSLVAIVPLAAINYFLVGWMADIDFEEDVIPFRFLWNMFLLVYLEAPLASAFVVAFFGPAVFMEKKSIRQVMSDVFRLSLPRPPNARGWELNSPLLSLVLCQLLLRGILPAWLLCLAINRFESVGFIEGFFLPCIAIYATAMRAFRPYINEIILLERNPLFTRDQGRITIGKRSGHLHGPSSGDLMVRWMSSAMVALLLFGLALATATTVLGVLVGMWPVSYDMMNEELVTNFSWLYVQIVFPLCLWLVVAYFSVVRFLSYLDLRIRHEGWEVELLMRAEALKLAERLG